MSVQDILFYVGIAFCAIAAVLGAGAAYLFFSRNIPDIMDDLSGKKRADAIALMAEPGTGMLRRSSRRKGTSFSASTTGPTTGSTTGPTTGSTTGQTGAQGSASTQLESTQMPAQTSGSISQPIPQTTAGSAELQSSDAPRGTNYNYIPQAEDEAEGTSVLAEEDSDDITVVFGSEELEDEPYNESTADNFAQEDEESEAAGGEEPGEPEAADDEEPEEPAEQEPQEHGDQEVSQDQDEEKAEVIASAAGEASQTPDWFQIVKTVVLTDSSEYVRVEQGEGHE